MQALTVAGSPVFPVPGVLRSLGPQPATNHPLAASPLALDLSQLCPVALNVDNLRIAIGYRTNLF